MDVQKSYILLNSLVSFLNIYPKARRVPSYGYEAAMGFNFSMA
jgi:hypothetical protein